MNILKDAHRDILPYSSSQKGLHSNGNDENGGSTDYCSPPLWKLHYMCLHMMLQSKAASASLSTAVM